MNYQFTNDWFGKTARYIWDAMLPKFGPTKILEIGSYEGRSACYMVEKLQKPLEIHCIDTWEGSREHQAASVDMQAVKTRFTQNLRVASERATHSLDLHVHEGRSDTVLASMLATHADYFDFVYVDGSHEAADVLSDGIQAFKLLRPGGVMCFDDYLWGMEGDYNPVHTPRMGIDAFAMTHGSRLTVLALPPTQFFVEKHF